MKRVILVRHGQTENNVNKIIQDGSDMLNDLGIDQARKVGKKLSEEDIDVIYSSDFPRAMDTAKEIGKFHDVDLIVEEGFREQELGCYCGKSGEEYGEVVDGLDESWADFAPEGGESVKAVQERVVKAFDKIAAENDGKNVLIVSHGGSLFSLMHHIYDEPLNKDSEYWHSNAGVTYLEKDGDKWKVVKYDDVGHLE